MNLVAESLLMVTGLLGAPGKDDFKASLVVQDDLQAQIKEILTSETPKKLRACPERKTYFDRLADEPDYDEIRAAVGAAMGEDTAEAYVALHTQARGHLLEGYPKMTVTGVVGDTVLPNDPISAGAWLIDVDVIEGMRLLRDFASGVLLRSSVATFKLSFGGTYSELRITLDREISRQKAKKASWQPDTWLHAAIRVFEEQPFGSKIEVKARPGTSEPATTGGPGAAAGKKALKDVIDGLKTPVGNIR